MTETLTVGALLIAASLMVGSFALPAVRRLIAAWTWFYTLPAEPEMRERQRLEVASDLSDHVRSDRVEGASNPEIALLLLARLAWSAPSDLAFALSCCPPVTLILWTSWAALATAIVAASLVFAPVGAFGAAMVLSSLTSLIGSKSRKRCTWWGNCWWDQFAHFFYGGYLVTAFAALWAIDGDYKDVLVVATILLTGEYVVRTRNAWMGTLAVACFTFACTYFVVHEPLYSFAAFAVLLAPSLIIGALFQRGTAWLRGSIQARREKLST